MLDIDYFRQYKDTYGHLVGNQAFHVAKRISDSMLQQRVEDREHQAVPVPTASQGIAVFPTEVQEISVSWIWQTGADMSSKYKETSQGGLAVNVVEC